MKQHQKSTEFWQQLNNFATEQKIGVGWWIILLIFLAMSASTLLVWRSLLITHQSQANYTLQLKPALSKPQTQLQPLQSKSLTFAGSGVSLEITRILAKQFQKTHPEIKINVPTSIGSSGAIYAAADGAIAVGMISRPLKAQEQKLGLTVIPIAKTPLAIATHLSVADDNITSTQLIDIYQGKKTQWLDGKEIIVLTREPGDSSILILSEKINGFQEVYTDSQINKRWTTLYKDQEMNQQLAQIPLTLGFVDIGTITSERKLSAIKTLKFNSVAPTLENVTNNRYPLVKNLYFVFEQGKIPLAAKEFINFVRSKEGEKILKAHGFLPLGEEGKK